MARPKKFVDLKAIPIYLEGQDRERMDYLAGQLCSGNKSELVRKLLAEKADQFKLNQLEQLETQQQEIESRKSALALEFQKAESQTKEIAQKKALCLKATGAVEAIRQKLTTEALKVIRAAPAPDRKYDLAVVWAQKLEERGINTTPHELLALAGEENSRQMFR